ncbi:hypothetical protein SAMN05216184_101490 [Georgenia satyanarayanai]|uniref:Uncharacterized protein n=1 Tax=Georgenia satyanarayanai TaxID=860221 RepID=A0A2Y8ZZ14_9MICO|nr:hypothetical protein [Georgenia satyanarayanai]PYG02025.1 hypothetical protein A8987_101490 [Georgenia satyanarayanai]SSA36836.1 hypothetical protein SAMN05216184_101490 [Georgenia satyanarayanai]
MTNHTTNASLPLGLRPSDVVTAAATGLLTLPDPARRTPLSRFALRTAVAGTTGAGVWWGTGEDPDLAAELPTRVAFTVGAAGLVYGAAELGETLDRALQRRLVRMGLRRPRLVMALTGVGVSLAMSLLERREADVTADDDAPEGPTLRPLPEHVRELVDAILAHTEDHDSLRLRAQLARASEEVWGEPEGAPRMVELAVPQDVPLAVPRSFTFPVSARFSSARGVPCTVQILVSGGRLAAAVVDVDDEAWEVLAEDWDPADGDPDPLADVTFPRAQDVTLVAESRG